MRTLTPLSSKIRINLFDPLSAVSKIVQNVNNCSLSCVISGSLSPVSHQRISQTKYTLAAVPPPGFLCYKCAKSYGGDPFKKPAAPRMRKAPADKRKVVHFEELKIPSLVTLCINVNSFLTLLRFLFSLSNRSLPSTLTTSRPWEISES